MTVRGYPTLSFPQCFVCGADNPVGLHVQFTRDGDDGCRADYVVKPEHVGWPGIIHGGILFTLMDEAIAWAVTFAGLRGVTGRAEVRFRDPATVGTPLVITGRIVDRARRVVRTRSEIRRAGTDDIVAELEGTVVLADVNQWERAVAP